MSGTSLDGADAVVADFSGTSPRTLAFASVVFPDVLRAELLALNTPGDNEIARAALAANQLAAVYANATKAVLTQAGIAVHDVAAIGCHGQTIRHRPDLAYTVQLNNPALLAELAGCSVVADFRSRDVAAGGQGAPLAPLFHDGVFRSADETRIVCNIGGIANLTILAPGLPVRGFDCGPGNCLMDAWIQQHLGTPYDSNGEWSRTGNVNTPLLARMLAMPWLASPPPKSTGRDDFNAAWLAAQLAGNETPADVQASLLAFTATTIAHHVEKHAADASRLIVCGGGAQNGALLEALQLRVKAKVERSDLHGVPAGQVEALAFAWFAHCALTGKPLDATHITGARHPNILGAIYPA